MDAASLHADVSGQGGPVLVLLHGFGGSAEAWRPVLDRLPQTIRVHAFDLPGHGRSLDFPGAGSAKAASKAVLAALDAQGVNRFHLAGHSMGGAVAALAALAAPERVQSLTLLAPGGIGPEINMGLLGPYAGAQDAQSLKAALAGMSASPVADGYAEALLARRQLPGQRDILIAIAGGMTRDGKQGMIPAEMLAGLTMPVTVFWGDKDAVLPFSQTALLPAHFEVRHLPGIGHMLIDEATAVIAAHLGQIAP